LTMITASVAIRIRQQLTSVYCTDDAVVDPKAIAYKATFE